METKNNGDIRKKSPELIKYELRASLSHFGEIFFYFSLFGLMAWFILPQWEGKIVIFAVIVFFIIIASLLYLLLAKSSEKEFMGLLRTAKYLEKRLTEETNKKWEMKWLSDKTPSEKDILMEDEIKAKITLYEDLLTEIKELLDNSFK